LNRPNSKLAGASVSRSMDGDCTRPFQTNSGLFGGKRRAASQSREAKSLHGSRQMAALRSEHYDPGRRIFGRRVDFRLARTSFRKEPFNNAAVVCLGLEILAANGADGNARDLSEGPPHPFIERCQDQ
jgi:hypothetical protein